MKKTLAILLMLAMFLAMLVIPTAAEDEVEDTFDPFAPSPTISTANDYINFFHEVYTNKTSFEGKTITLMNDIALNDTTAADWFANENAVRLSTTRDTWAWFNGTFDGGNHTLRGVIVEGTFRMNDVPCGIFPYAMNATIKNLTVDGFFVCSTNTLVIPIWGRAGIGGLIGHANKNITVDNCTLKNGYITSIEGGKGAMGALIGVYDGEMSEAERKSGKTMNLSVTNTTVEESVHLEKGNSDVSLIGGIFGYVESNYQSHPSTIDLSASKIQPKGSMDAENPLPAIGKFRHKVGNDANLGATFTIKNNSTTYEQKIEMDGTGVVDQEPKDETGEKGTFPYKNYTKDYNDAILASGSYGSGYVDLNSYTVTWDVNGVKSTEVYPQGAMPSYKDSTEKPMTDTKLYVFTGWDPELAPVTANVTYTAQYEEYDKVVVTWKVDGKETVEYYKKGDMPNFKGETQKEQDDTAVYSFKGWDKEIVAATEDVTYTAVYDVKNKYKITWVIDGKETVETYLAGVKPSYKGKPTKAEDDEYTYKFIGWDKELVAASENATYTAVFEKTAKNATTTGDGKTEEKGGCGSSISVGFVSLMVIGMAGAFAFRKKHD